MKSLPFLAAALFATVASAADWTPELLPPEQGIRAPLAPVRFRLPALPPETLEKLALELDSFDVTAYVSSADGRQAVFTPPQPLSHGKHELRLVEYLAGGQMLERGRWTLEIRSGEGYREASLNGNLVFNLTHRLASHNLAAATPGPNQADGALSLRGALADGDWKLTGAADLLGNSQHGQLPRKDGPIDLATFLLTAEKGPVVAQVGHHAVGPDSLVMQGFSRRGVSAGVKSADGGATLTAFALNTGNVIGFQDGLGVGDADKRTVGAVASIKPLAGQDLNIWGTWVSGAGQDQTGASGSGVAGAAARSKGQAAALSGYGTFLDNRVQVRAETARSHFDADGPGTDTNGDGVIDSNEPYRDGNGHLLMINWSPWDKLEAGGRPAALSFGLERRLAGTWFRSPAAPGAARDTDLWKGGAHFDWAGVHGDASLARATDNVDDQPNVARSRSLQSNLSMGWYPEYARDAGGQPAIPWYGQPYLGLALGRTELDVINGTSALTAGALHRTDSLTLSATFSGGTWSWGVSQTLGKDEDLRQTAPDLSLSSTQLFASLQVGERLTLGPTVSYSITSESDAPAGVIAKDRKTLTAGLYASYTVSETLNLGAGYTLSDDKTSDGSAKRRAQDLNARLSWIVAPPKERRPGLTLMLDGSQHDESGSSAGADNWQVFLRAVIGLPFAL
ncbi:MAG: hypothetical protein PHD37_10045 [Gallionellaceae bacterium]|nr:hypothetical protein [Gallionellaceae bacterium]